MSGRRRSRSRRNKTTTTTTRRKWLLTALTPTTLLILLLQTPLVLGQGSPKTSSSTSSVPSASSTTSSTSSIEGNYLHSHSDLRLLPTTPNRDWRDVHAQLFRYPICLESGGYAQDGRDSDLLSLNSIPTMAMTTSVTSATSSSSSSSKTITTESETRTPANTDTDTDSDSDSPLDNANFLSFEDWKKANLAKVGQSAENVGGRSRGGSGPGTGKDDHQRQRRPSGIINNALDSLGEDAEIELDFGGFGAGAEAPGGVVSAAGGGGGTQGTWRGTAGGVYATGGAGAGVRRGGDGDEAVDDADTDIGADADVDAAANVLPRTSPSRRRDAGTTCKERFNYASFDCAATVLKTNPECKGSSSVLIENKDSYMLNECGATNKFLILELCDDILVDTVVLANYEFFSSIFRTFRVSVADRYPAKSVVQWKELGVYEARNTREVQAFAVENPLIWARYLKVEFLTHYGNEFYCPVSLIRVHGTTMLEEYKHDGEAGRLEEEVEVEVAEEMVDESQKEVTESEMVKEPQEAMGGHSATEAPVEDDATVIVEVAEVCPVTMGDAMATLFAESTFAGDVCNIDEQPPSVDKDHPVIRPAQNCPPQAKASITPGEDGSKDSKAEISSTVRIHDDDLKKTEQGDRHATSSTMTTLDSEPRDNSTSSETSDSRSSPPPKAEHTPSPEATTRSTATQPPASNPTTQESFFKSVNKRLQMLESNSTLSLLYIEEQSRILRDAFTKVEKRQLAKTTTFLETLNTTVLSELRQFRDQYDQIWRSVALEFEHQRVQYHREIESLSTQLGVLADEIVFQKRVSVIQSVVVLFCFALVLFARGSAVVGSYIELPAVQNMVGRGYGFRPSSPILFGSGSPTSVRDSPVRTTSQDKGGDERSETPIHSHSHRRSPSVYTGVESPNRPVIAYSPPTPTSDTRSLLDGQEEEEEKYAGASPPPSSSPPQLSPPDPMHMHSIIEEPLLRPQSSPPVLNGCVEDNTNTNGDSPSSVVSTPRESFDGEPERTSLAIPVVH